MKKLAILAGSTLLAAPLMAQTSGSTDYGAAAALTGALTPINGVLAAGFGIVIALIVYKWIKRGANRA